MFDRCSDWLWLARAFPPFYVGQINGYYRYRSWMICALIFDTILLCGHGWALRYHLFIEKDYFRQCIEDEIAHDVLGSGLSNSFKPSLFRSQWIDTWFSGEDNTQTVGHCNSLCIPSMHWDWPHGSRMHCEFYKVIDWRRPLSVSTGYNNTMTIRVSTSTLYKPPFSSQYRSSNSPSLVVKALL